MDFRDGPAETEFRLAVREWIHTSLPPSLKGDGGEGEWGQLASGHERDKEALALWRQRLQSRGWVAPAWPRRFGGAELPVMQQFIPVPISPASRPVPSAMAMTSSSPARRSGPAAPTSPIG